MNPNPTPESETITDPDALLKTAEQVARHPLVKTSVDTVYAVKKAAKGTPDDPFTGRITTARKFNTWILNHREFVASHWLRKKKPKDENSSKTKNSSRLQAVAA